jgi:hypothetical protein
LVRSSNHPKPIKRESGYVFQQEQKKKKKVVGSGASYTHIHSNCKVKSVVSFDIAETTDEGAIIAQRKPTKALALSSAV